MKYFKIMPNGIYLEEFWRGVGEGKLEEDGGIDQVLVGMDDGN